MFSVYGVHMSFLLLFCFSYFTCQLKLIYNWDCLRHFLLSFGLRNTGLQCWLLLPVNRFWFLALVTCSPEKGATCITNMSLYLSKEMVKSSSLPGKNAKETRSRSNLMSKNSISGLRGNLGTLTLLAGLTNKVILDNWQSWKPSVYCRSKNWNIIVAFMVVHPRNYVSIYLHICVFVCEEVTE